MKKKPDYTPDRRRKLFKFQLIMRMFTAFCLIFVLNTQASPIQAQQSEIQLNLKDRQLTEVLKLIQQQSGYRFLYSNELLKDTKVTDLQIQSKNIHEVMAACLRGQALNYEIRDKIIMIKAAAPQTQRSRKISGVVVDSKTDQPIPGVTVVAQLNGTPVTGTATSEKGSFELNVPSNIKELTFTCIGYKILTYTLDDMQELTVRMQEEVNSMDEVVVTGYFTKSKASYTGAVKSVSGAELKAISSTNVIAALSALTPGLELVDRNELGSNPNRVPELLLRGASSFQNANINVNQPTIILDGAEISMQELYDLDMNEIENITVLKDASASALYGARAGNGVIVVERKKLAESPMRVTYNFTANVQFPYLKDYKLLNATDKLEYERLAGLYSAEDQKDQWGQPQPNSYQYTLDSLYNARYMEVQRGVNSDWLSQPARVGFSHDHSLRVYGGSANVRYELQGRFNNTQGVMKEDLRRRYNLGFKLEYHLRDKLTVTNRTTYTEVGTKQTPYGSFTNYTLMNPYDRIYDAYGRPNTDLSWDNDNPLYEAKVGNYSKDANRNLANTLDLRWDISKLFRIMSNFNISIDNGDGEDFTSPFSQKFKKETDNTKKGNLTKKQSKAVSYSGNLIGSLNKVYENNSLVSLTAGLEIRKENNESSQLTATGFFDNNSNFVGNAVGYSSEDTYKPSGTEGISSEIGGFINANYMYNNRYYLDAVYRLTGSSKFGANNRWGNFWSGGIGWNLHNENFLQSDKIDLLKIRGSVGYTGKVNFEPYQAMTIYRYSNNLEYKNGIGAVPLTIGNPDLKWEREFSYDIGTDISLFGRRLNLTLDIYLKRTTDLLLDASKVPSTGTTLGKENIGKMENKGIEFQLDGFVIQRNDLYWQIGLTGYANRNKILKISDALKEQNKANNEASTPEPLPQYEENESTTALKVVRSAGIDPATGKEVFIKRDGTRTFVFDPLDKYVVGDTEPKFRGNVSSNFFYKGFSLYLLLTYKCGGYLYNTTRATKVEGSDPKYNADERVFYSRWHEAGNIAVYKDIKDSSTPNQTDRFVEKENVFTFSTINLGYEFPKTLCQKLRMRNLRVGLNLTDILRFSNVKIERGTEYLYSNGFEFTLSTTF